MWSFAVKSGDISIGLCQRRPRVRSGWEQVSVQWVKKGYGCREIRGNLQEANNLCQPTFLLVMSIEMMVSGLPFQGGITQKSGAGKRASKGSSAKD